jgi:hypothetical protein
VAGDDDAAAAGGHGLLDAVLDAQAGGLDGVLEDGRVLVIADAADVDHAVGRQDVLGAAGRVLGGAAGDELGIEVVQEILVEGLVLLLGQDGVVGLEAVLVKQGLVAEGLDVCAARVDMSVYVETQQDWRGWLRVVGRSNVPRRGFSKQKRAYSLFEAIVSKLKEAVY